MKMRTNLLTGQQMVDWSDVLDVEVTSHDMDEFVQFSEIDGAVPTDVPIEAIRDCTTINRLHKFDLRTIGRQTKYMDLPRCDGHGCKTYSTHMVTADRHRYFFCDKHTLDYVKAWRRTTGITKTKVLLSNALVATTNRAEQVAYRINGPFRRAKSQRKNLRALEAINMVRSPSDEG